MIRLLFIDDDPQAQTTLKMVLGAHYHVHSAFTGATGLSLLEKTDPEVVLLDINLPDLDGLEVLKEILAKPGAPPVIMLTSYPDVDFVKEAIQTGAYDYILKPYELKKLEGTLRRAVQNRLLRNGFDPADTKAESALAAIRGESKVLRELKVLLRRYGPTDSPVLIQGETGTGKELVARAIHHLSPRQDGPFVPVNCGAIPEALLETELFGAEKGAFTDAITRPGCFEQANGGTIFLDEIGEMMPFAQVKLLRVLDSKICTRVGSTKPISLNIRVLSATNRDLKQEIEKSRFRTDLFFRLRVLVVVLPALRERLEDIPLLAVYFLQEYSGANRGGNLSPGAVEKLLEHTWPGNVRELKNVIERAAVLAENGRIRPEDIQFH